MKKQCVILNGRIYHIGDWDYMRDEDGNPTNPLPEGATVEERDFEYSPETGWHEVGKLLPPTTQERIEALEAALMEVILGG